jgi:transposase-like protein
VADGDSPDLRVEEGMSALQFQRMLGMTYRSAWFMATRLRHAMAEDGTFKLDGTVEVDETYVGARKVRGSKRGRPGPESPKVPVLALVQRGGAARAFPVERITGETLRDAMQKHVKADATIMTDELRAYRQPGAAFADHQTVNHGDGEYVRGDAHVNTTEGFLAPFKRGVVGTFHHISKGHMHRYRDEFAFRNTNRISLGVDDVDRAKLLVLAAEGKRLTFKQPSGTRAAQPRTSERPVLAHRGA